MKNLLFLVPMFLLGLGMGCGPTINTTISNPGVEQAPVVRPSTTPVLGAGSKGNELIVSYAHRYAHYQVKRELKKAGFLRLASAPVSLPSSGPNRIRVSFEVPSEVRDPNSLFVNASYSCGYSNPQLEVYRRMARSEMSVEIGETGASAVTDIDQLQDAFAYCRSDRITMSVNLYTYDSKATYVGAVRVPLIQKPKANNSQEHRK